MPRDLVVGRGLDDLLQRVNRLVQATLAAKRQRNANTAGRRGFRVEFEGPPGVGDCFGIVAHRQTQKCEIDMGIGEGFVNLEGTAVVSLRVREFPALPPL
ncbi:MAG TPA: hypothetical protein VMR25_19425, partial [Planctomycetaceae bacterium]|nr:hypothetical protein [Planctomycetaceae bacterium]